MQRPFFIAEIGINHNGDLGIAKRLIDLAKEAGCDAVKFQKRSIDRVYTPEFLSSARDSPWGKTQRAQKEGLEFGKQAYEAIDAYCRKKGILWSASAWDTESQEFLREFRLPFHKVASAMLTHLPLLRLIAAEGRHTYISTGMSTIPDIDRAVEIFRSAGCPFTLLHCVSTYPSDEEECNLSVIPSLARRYGCEVGYSGHEKGMFPTLLAMALGATAIERHITLDKAMYGSDQAASLDPEELRMLMKELDRVLRIMGGAEKTVSSKEQAIAQKLRYFSG